jgi:hypothetical protein
MKKIVSIIALTSMFGSVMADELRFHTVSFHESSTYQQKVDYVTPSGLLIKTEYVNIPYNNNNFGVAYQNDSSWLFGYYYNSYKKNTFYIAKEFMITEDLGVVGGLGTGYNMENVNKINATGALIYKVPVDDKYSFNTMFIPPLGDRTGLIHFTVSYKIK